MMRNGVILMRKGICLFFLLCLLSSFVFAGTAEEPFPAAEYSWHPKYPICTYESETLRYSLGKFGACGTTCYLAEVWVADPYRQIGKVSAPWKEAIALPLTMVESVPEIALAVNGSGYVSPVYPWIPDNYPGTNADYYYTPLGSLTVTDGEVYRDLEGVPYYGITLEKDGLQMYTGEENSAVLANEPFQTWSFYVQCPLIRDNESILNIGWSFAERSAMRTVIARTDRNNYLILTVSNSGTAGMTLFEVVDFLLYHYDHIEWAYNLDGGPSSALIYRRAGKKLFHTLWGGKAKDMDILYFKELTE